MALLAELLNPAIQQFIHDHERDDEKALVLKYKNIHGLASSLVAEQIAGRKKAREKLPLYYNTPGIIYPPTVNIEQSSSEQAAQYKSTVIKDFLPQLKTAIDLTGGFGIDTYFLSRVFEQVHHVEPNGTLAELAQHNHQLLSAGNITYHNRLAEPFLNDVDDRVDLIFIDPSRRADGHQKVFRFADCQPDVVTLLPKLFAITDHVLIKSSPLLDIQQGIKELKNVTKVFVTAVDNECKEVLFFCTKDALQEEVSITATNISKGVHEAFTFTPAAEKVTNNQFAAPLKFLYEPNAALLKAGAFKIIGAEFNLLKLDVSTHLYTSETLVPHFPGRIFAFKAFVKNDPSSIAENFPGEKANIITRNYPLSAEALKKKLRLKDGGENYLLAVSTGKQKLLCAVTRIK